MKAFASPRRMLLANCLLPGLLVLLMSGCASPVKPSVIATVSPAAVPPLPSSARQTPQRSPSFSERAARHIDSWASMLTESLMKQGAEATSVPPTTTP